MYASQSSSYQVEEKGKNAIHCVLFDSSRVGRLISPQCPASRLHCSSVPQQLIRGATSRAFLIHFIHPAFFQLVWVSNQCPSGHKPASLPSGQMLPHPPLTLRTSKGVWIFQTADWIGKLQCPVSLNTQGRISNNKRKEKALGESTGSLNSNGSVQHHFADKIQLKDAIIF